MTSKTKNQVLLAAAVVVALGIVAAVFILHPFSVVPPNGPNIPLQLGSVTMYVFTPYATSFTYTLYDSPSCSYTGLNGTTGSVTTAYGSYYPGPGVPYEDGATLWKTTGVYANQTFTGYGGLMVIPESAASYACPYIYAEIVQGNNTYRETYGAGADSFYPIILGFNFSSPTTTLTTTIPPAGGGGGGGGGGGASGSATTTLTTTIPATTTIPPAGGGGGGVAPWYQPIIDFFNGIAAWFANLFR